MYKRIIFSSILFFAFIILIDKAFFNSPKNAIPNPEPHINRVFYSIKMNNLPGFMKMILPKEIFEKMKEEAKIEFLTGFPDMDESMAKMAWDLIEESEIDVWKEYTKEIEKDFEDVRKDIPSANGIEIERIQWKLVGNSKLPNQFRCNAKIFVKVGSKKYCIKYKNFIFYGGKWYAGNLTDVDELTEQGFEYMPDMYQGPAVEEYIDESEVVPLETPEEAIEMESNSEDSPKMEED